MYGGWEYEAIYEFTYSDFDTLTLSEACKIENFFSDLNWWLEYEDMAYVDYKLQDFKKVHIQPTSADLRTIADDWEENSKRFTEAFEEVNKSLVADFKELWDNRIRSETMSDFLKQINIDRSNNGIVVSSPYGKQVYTGLQEENNVAIVLKYLEDIVEIGTVLIEDFSDDNVEIACAVGERFGD
jgi:hypothetical protein